MTRRMITGRTGRALFAALMVLVLAVRIVVPTGFMPTATGEGMIVSICTGDGPMTKLIKLGQDHSSDERKDGQGPCTFAGTLGAGFAVEAFQIAQALPFADAPILGAAIADLTVHRLAAPPPPSHGPPARA